MDGAIADLLTVHRLARVISRNPRLLDHLVGIAIDALASHNDISLAAGGKLTVKQAKVWLAQMQSLPPLANFAEALDTCERYYALNQVMLMARSWDGNLSWRLYGLSGLPIGCLPKDLMDWDFMLRRINSWYNRMIEVVGKESFSERKMAWAAMELELEKKTTTAGTNTTPEIS